MAMPQSWNWASHIISKDKNTLLCKECNKTQKIPMEPFDEETDEKKIKKMWMARIKSIGVFVTKHRYCCSIS